MQVPPEGILQNMSVLRVAIAEPRDIKRTGRVYRRSAERSGMRVEHGRDASGPRDG